MRNTCEVPISNLHIHSGCPSERHPHLAFGREVPGSAPSPPPGTSQFQPNVTNSWLQTSSVDWFKGKPIVLQQKRRENNA